MIFFEHPHHLGLCRSLDLDLDLDPASFLCTKVVASLLHFGCSEVIKQYEQEGQSLKLTPFRHDQIRGQFF